MDVFIVALLPRFFWRIGPRLFTVTPAFHVDFYGRLIAELRRLGAFVVFASFQKVIIATNKSDVKAARDYAKFVVSTVTSRDLFNTLQVQIHDVGGV